MPNFEVLDARIASALNKIIHNSHFKRRISLEEQKAQKQDSFLRGRQIAYLIYDHFRVTGIHDSVENYADLFIVSLRNDDIQEFDSTWDEILLSMMKIPPDDILEGLFKLRIRESEKLKTEKTSWDMMQQVAPHREEPLLEGNAHSVRYGEMIHDGSGKPEKLNHQEEANSETFVMGSDAAEFVNKVKDQVRKRQERMSNVADSGEEHSIIWGMFMAATMNAATFMGKNFQDSQNSIMNTTDLTLKKMFDITVKLVNEQEEINNVDKFHWERHSWKKLSLIGDETVINLQRTKVYVFSDSVLCLGRIHQHPESNEAWKKRIEWITTSQSYRDYDGINGEPTEFEWNIFPGFTTLQLCGKVTDLLSNLGETPETFTGRILFMSMFNDISCDGKGNKEECLANANVGTILAKKFGIGQWSFIDPRDKEEVVFYGRE